ncbi:hypothetical protein EC973_004595 [Apophysomyces ossiformis]|uniref:Myb-like domain-containing protein n=1 Tax=Apophysomyces ossiformis TaxID=679940 RepID=A0A8H7BSU3_9FUNG|nr:hypothetical protein EC973_004595 [Apophysomyces ossiformis]
MNWDSPSKPTNVLSLSISRKRKLLEAAAKQASSVDNPHSSSSKKIAATISEDLRKSTNDRPKSHSPDIERMDDDDMDGSFWQQVIDIEQKVRLPESERIDADVDIASNDACEHVPNMQQDCTVSTDNVEMTTPMLASLSVSDPGRKQKKLVGEDVFTRSSVKEWQAPRIKAWEGRYLRATITDSLWIVPGEGQRNGGWSREEHKLFMERYNEWISRGWKIGASWGLFSKEIPHRVGYQCMNYYRKLVSERKLQDESYAIIDGKLKQIHKDRAPGGEIPTTDLGSEWDGEDVKEVERNVDLWLKEFHNRSGSAAVRSIAAPKPKAAPRVAKTITGKKSNIGDLVKKQKPATVIDGDDDFMMESMEPEQVQLNGSNYDWEKDWNERLDKLREFMRPYLDKETREAYWHAKQHWRQGLATTEMLLMKKPIQKSVASTEGNDHSKAVARTQASLSRFFTGVKKAKVDTPDEMISNVRIPNDLYSGVRQITPFTVWKSRQINEERVHYYELEDMMDCTSVLESLLQQKETDLSHSPLEGILVDPPWEFYINDGRNDGRCSWNLKTMATLLEKVVDQMSAGLVFIWTHKLIQADVVRMMSSIKNLVWFKKSINNVPLDQPSPYISSTKEILLMFKKGDGFELRHQRTADVIIDFELPRSQWIHQGSDRCSYPHAYLVTIEFTEPKPLAVYDMIETLLPKAGYDEQLKRGRLLELWAKSASPRREGWIAFHQKKHVQQTTNEPMSIADP